MMKKTLISTAILALATLMSVPAVQAKEWKTVTIGLEGAYEPWNLTKPDGTMILNSVWGYDCFPNTRTVDAHVVKLRQKMEPNPNTPRHFLTVHGVGYRFLP